MKKQIKTIKTTSKEFPGNETNKTRPANKDWQFDYSNYLTACSLMDEEEFASM